MNAQSNHLDMIQFTYLGDFRAKTRVCVGPDDEDAGISASGRLRCAIAAGVISRRIPPGVFRIGEGWADSTD